MWYIFNKMSGMVIQDTSSTILMENFDLFYKALNDTLCKCVTDTSFINKYGRSKVNPMFLTLYYTEIMSQPEFIKNFLDNLPLREILLENLGVTETINKIENLFYLYVEQSIKNFESRIIKVISLCIDASALILAYKDFSLYKRYSADILTQSIYENDEFKNQYKLLYKSVRVMIGLFFIWVSLFGK